MFNIEVIVISVIWLLTIVIGLLVILYFKTHRQRQTDFTGWTFGIILWEIFIAILCSATIVAYLTN